MYPFRERMQVISCMVRQMTENGCGQQLVRHDNRMGVNLNANALSCTTIICGTDFMSFAPTRWIEEHKFVGCRAPGQSSAQLDKRMSVKTIAEWCGAYREARFKKRMRHTIKSIPCAQARRQHAIELVCVQDNQKSRGIDWQRQH